MARDELNSLRERAGVQTTALKVHYEQGWAWD
jgi:hypothetical protein